MIQHPQVKLYHLKPQGMLYVDINLLCETERVKKAKLEELSNNISDRSEAKGTGKLSDSLLSERSEVSGKSALYCIIYVDIILLCETESSIARAERVKKAKLEELSNNISDRSET